MTSSVVKLLFYFYLFYSIIFTILLGREKMTIAGGTVMDTSGQGMFTGFG